MRSAMIDDAAILIVEDDADVQRAARIALAGSCQTIEVLDRPRARLETSSRQAASMWCCWT